MSKITTVKWLIDPHTEAKHAILKKYLAAWFPIITRFSKRVIVVDGFAGPGEYSNGQDGSPIIAINTFLEHKAEMKSEVIFYFIEKNKDRCEHLKKKLLGHSHLMPSNMKYNIDCSEFSETLTSVLDDLDSKSQQLAPSFFFIDPFGYKDIPMELIKRIMSYKKCEVFITFMYEEINRFIAVDSQELNANKLFGTDEWKKVKDAINPDQRVEILHSLYKKQLETMAGIKYVRYFKMINKSNKTDYFLFFGTNSIVGLKHMKRAMWMVDENGTYQFSDATYNPNQLTLFEAEPNYGMLKSMIVDKYKGSVVSVENLKEFIIVETPFLETNYKKKILNIMEKNGEIKVHGKRIKGTYPDERGISIEFL
ncbi:MAG: three-Cys-motif partner protein TcmP [Candidatus Kaelpia aquatica]|nr:three-Cys-motif partner protein TcmP [Candidatus Kaelpia aquatica]